MSYYIKLNDILCGNDEALLDLVKHDGLRTLDLQFQDGAIGDVGVNGVQWTVLLEIALTILKKLNGNFPCRENSMTITKLEEALMWQEARTKEREKRGVEGKNQK